MYRFIYIYIYTYIYSLATITGSGAHDAFLQIVSQLLGQHKLELTKLG